MALPGMSRRRAGLRAADICARVSSAAFAGSGALPSSSSASGASRPAKASTAAGKYSRSWCRSRRGLPDPLPDQRLTGTRHHLDRPRARAVARHGAQLAGIGAHHAGQHVRVTGIFSELTRPSSGRCASPGQGPSDGSKSVLGWGDKQQRGEGRWVVCDRKSAFGSQASGTHPRCGLAWRARDRSAASGNDQPSL